MDNFRISQTMIFFRLIRVTSLFLICSCKGDDIEDVEIIGFLDTPPKNSPYILNVNGEPVRWLAKSPSYPRYSSDYPLRKGMNEIRLSSVDGGKAEANLFRFFCEPQSNFRETIDDNANVVSVNVTLLKKYTFPAAEGRGVVTEDVVRRCRVVSVKMLKLLSEKKLKDFRMCFVGGYKGSELADSAIFNSKFKMDFVELNQSQLGAKKGKALILIHPPYKNKSDIEIQRSALISGMLGNVEFSISQFLFAISKNDKLLFRAEARKWLEVIE